MDTINIAVASMNQVPMEWNLNYSNILDAIRESSADCAILLTPEMSIMGYDSEDMFLSHDAFKRSMDRVGALVSYLASNNISLNVIVGAPLMMPSGQVFNGSFWLNKDGIQGISLKPNLAGEGLHYEPRWFKSWPMGQQTEITYADLFSDRHEQASRRIPVGDLLFDFNGAFIGIECCEAAFAVNRPAIEYYQRGVDVLLNPSASHMAVEPGYDKYDVRKDIVKSASRSLGIGYVYANLQGCIGGRSIYDGGNIIASNGNIVATGPRFSFKECDVLKATIDIQENRTARSMHSETIKGSVFRIIVKDDNERIAPYIAPEIDDDEIALSKLAPVSQSYQKMSRGMALGLWDWGRKTRLGKYALSLSGGADSAMCAALVYLSHVLAYKDLGKDLYRHILSGQGLNIKVESLNDIAEKVMPVVLMNAYQKTENNSHKTEDAAKSLADGIGASFVSINIQSLVDEYTRIFDGAVETPLSWDNPSDDITMQNLQARVRNPSIWLFANREGRLLITTSNKSENAVGYYTQDGDSCGCVAPIGGVSKSHIVGNPEKSGHHGLLRELGQFGILTREGDRYVIPGMEKVIALKPTAELRKQEKLQSDEDDLMPFPILDEIEDWHQISRLPPKDILVRIHRTRTSRYTLRELAMMVQRYIELYVRSEWKRNKNSVAFHIEKNSLDPKTYSRFPVLNSGLTNELQTMWEFVESEEELTSRV